MRAANGLPSLYTMSGIIGCHAAIVVGVVTKADMDAV